MLGLHAAMAVSVVMGAVVVEDHMVMEEALMSPNPWTGVSATVPLTRAMSPVSKTALTHQETGIHQLTGFRISEAVVSGHMDLPHGPIELHP